jgi:probable HAF family extracellular repeat protein
LFIYRPPGWVTDLGPAFAEDINDNDVITGTKLFQENHPVTAFRLDASSTPAVYEDLGAGPGAEENWGSWGYGINNHGVVVGKGSSATGTTRAFVHFPDSSPDAGWYDLNYYVGGSAEWQLEMALGINDLGQIVGAGSRLGKDTAFLLTPTEPPSGEGSSLPPWMKAKRTEDLVAVLLLLLGGAPFGASGTGVYPSGRPIPIDPHTFASLSPAEQDVLIGRAAGELAQRLNDPSRRDDLTETTRAVVRAALDEVASMRATTD